VAARASTRCVTQLFSGAEWPAQSVGRKFACKISLQRRSLPPSLARLCAPDMGQELAAKKHNAWSVGCSALTASANLRRACSNARSVRRMRQSYSVRCQWMQSLCRQIPPLKHNELSAQKFLPTTDPSLQ
jgi:hypothetical protein